MVKCKGRRPPENEVLEELDGNSQGSQYQDIGWGQSKHPSCSQSLAPAMRPCRTVDNVTWLLLIDCYKGIRPKSNWSCATALNGGPSVSVIIATLSFSSAFIDILVLKWSYSVHKLPV